MSLLEYSVGLRIALLIVLSIEPFTENARKSVSLAISQEDELEKRDERSCHIIAIHR